MNKIKERNTFSIEVNPEESSPAHHFWQVGKLFFGRWENYLGRWENYLGGWENYFGRWQNNFGRWKFILAGGRIILAGQVGIFFWKVGKLFWQVGNFFLAGQVWKLFFRWENYFDNWWQVKIILAGGEIQKKTEEKSYSQIHKYEVLMRTGHIPTIQLGFWRP